MRSEITQLLERAAGGERDALDAVFHELYPELQRIAAGRIRGHKVGTLSPTILVHELYEKLAGSSSFSARDRKHFFSCAARAMRHIIVDHARAKNADKRGGQAFQVSYEETRVGDIPLDALELEEAFCQLEQIDPTLLEIVELRFFTGLSMDHIAKAMGVSQRTLYRRWQLARATLQALLDESTESG
ncbi:MAG: ECF-type sigma factor [Pseudomonadota bacterium]